MRSVLRFRVHTDGTKELLSKRSVRSRSKLKIAEPENADYGTLEINRKAMCDSVSSFQSQPPPSQNLTDLRKSKYKFR